jgi:hypothetical protein
MHVIVITLKEPHHGQAVTAGSSGSEKTGGHPRLGGLIK